MKAAADYFFMMALFIEYIFAYFINFPIFISNKVIRFKELVDIGAIKV